MDFLSSRIGIAFIAIYFRHSAMNVWHDPQRDSPYEEWIVAQVHSYNEPGWRYDDEEYVHLYKVAPREKEAVSGGGGDTDAAAAKVVKAQTSPVRSFKTSCAGVEITIPP